MISLSKKKIEFALFSVLISCALFLSCNKNKDAAVQGNSSALSIFITDDPAKFDSVWIDMQAIEAKIDTSIHAGNLDHCDPRDNNDNHHSDSFGVWQSLSIMPGIYNIAQLRNGIETLLASGNITGVVRK